MACARNLASQGQKIKFLGADEELLGGGGAGSACVDAADEATWIRAGCCWRTSAAGGPDARIREVLANYQEGTTALRELIQNADDAGASRVRVCLDLRAHGAYSLLAPALAQWQGPALLAHNDAAFTDDDFASISRIGGSKKTGRFAYVC